MADQHWENLKEIFHSAIALAPNERAAYLDHVCAGDVRPYVVAELYGCLSALPKLCVVIHLFLQVLRELLSWMTEDLDSLKIDPTSQQTRLRRSSD